jgi:hypothetical protein
LANPVIPYGEFLKQDFCFARLRPMFIREFWSKAADKHIPPKGNFGYFLPSGSTVLGLKIVYGHHLPKPKATIALQPFVQAWYKRYYGCVYGQITWHTEKACWPSIRHKKYKSVCQSMV